MRITTSAVLATLLLASLAFADDGSGCGPGTGARWTFNCVGPGLAIQDY